MVLEVISWPLGAFDGTFENGSWKSFSDEVPDIEISPSASAMVLALRAGSVMRKVEVGFASLQIWL